MNVIHLSTELQNNNTHERGGERGIPCLAKDVAQGEKRVEERFVRRA